MEPMVMVHRRPRYSAVGLANPAPKKAPPVNRATTAPLLLLVSRKPQVACVLRFGGSIGGAKGLLVGLRSNDLSNDTQIITKEKRSKGRKHSDEELINLGLHDGFN